MMKNSDIIDYLMISGKLSDKTLRIVRGTSNLWDRAPFSLKEFNARYGKEFKNCYNEFIHGMYRVVRQDLDIEYWNNLKGYYDSIICFINNENYSHTISGVGTSDSIERLGRLVYINRFMGDTIKLNGELLEVNKDQFDGAELLDKYGKIKYTDVAYLERNTITGNINIVYNWDKNSDIYYEEDKFKLIF